MSDKFSISPTEVHRLEGQKLSLQPDFVAVEEPLEIKLLVGDSTAAQPISVTMRTPGNDESLALGFLFTEGIIKHGNDVQSIHLTEDPSGNALTVQLKSNVTVDLAKLERHFYTTSSCGVCGKASLEAVQQQCNIELPKTQWKVPSQVLYSLPDSLRNQQANFAQTGGIHGCALFDLDGNFILSAEDVGRHNALDKLIGQMYF
jgi:FdhD protein